MTEAPRGPIVVDTNVFSARLRTRANRLTALYDPIITGRRWLISFQTLMEVESGALRAGWGPARRARLATLIADAEVVWPGTALTETCVALRVQCWNAGHALAQRIHNADLWIAATAIHLGLPLVADDGIFDGVPGLVRERAGG